MEVNSRSFLFQALSAAQLQEFSLRYLQEPLIHAKLMSGGLFNTTYLLETSRQKAVLRLGPVNRHLLLPYEENLMEAEGLLMALLAKKGIPTSTVLALDTSRTFLDRDFMLAAYLPADSMANAGLPEPEIARLSRQVGELTRKMHAITAADLPSLLEKPYGRCALVLSGQGCATWREAILQEAEQWQNFARRVSLFPETEFARIDRCFQRLAPLLDAVSQPCFVHGDLWHGNILVSKTGELMAIIDCDRALFGDPEFELATGWMIGADFLGGYGRQPDSSPEAALRRGLYKLLLDLEDCYFLRHEYDNPTASDAVAEQILSAVAKLETAF